MATTPLKAKLFVKAARTTQSQFKPIIGLTRIIMLIIMSYIIVSINRDV